MMRVVLHEFKFTNVAYFNTCGINDHRQQSIMTYISVFDNKHMIRGKIMIAMNSNIPNILADVLASYPS